MRVLLVTRAGIGGAARHLLDVVRGLSDKHELTVLASPLEDPRFHERLEAAGAEVHALPLFRRPHPAADLRAVVLLRALISRGRFDLIHAHTAKAGALARIAAGRLPALYSPHGFYHGYPTARASTRRVSLLAERILARRTSLLALTAEWERDKALAAGLSPAGAPTVIPNGVPAPGPLPPGERTAVRRDLGLAEGERMVLMVGRLKLPKDPHLFLRAAAMATDRLRFVLVGAGPFLRTCRALAPENAIVTGRRNDVPRLLHAADVAVLATRFEACPYFLLEAMAAGVPTVATDVPGTREVLGESGVLVPPGDPGALAGAVQALARDETGSAREGVRLRERARGCYSVGAMLTATEDAWQRVAANAKPG